MIRVHCHWSIHYVLWIGPQRNSSKFPYERRALKKKKKKEWFKSKKNIEGKEINWEVHLQNISKKKKKQSSTAMNLCRILQLELQGKKEKKNKRKFYELFTSHPYSKLVVYNFKSSVRSPSFCRSLILFF